MEIQKDHVRFRVVFLAAQICECFIAVPYGSDSVMQPDFFENLPGQDSSSAEAIWVLSRFYRY